MPCACAALTNCIEAGRSAERGFHREGLGRIVAPRVIHREFGDRHDLDGVDSQIAQVGQLRQHFGERAVAMAGSVVEGAHVHFVDHQFIPRRHRKVVACPVEIGIVNDGVARRIDHFARVRILPPDQSVLAAHG